MHYFEDLPELALRGIASKYDQVEFRWYQMCEVVAYNDENGHCLSQVDRTVNHVTASWYKHNDWPPIATKK